MTTPVTPEIPAELRPIAVIGPTGSGKSDLGLDLAEHYGGEVVNTDAMQQYRGMDIGTNKLPPAERRGILHHQLDTLDVTDTASVAAFQDAAVADMRAIMARGRRPILVGGSMMYVQALVDDWQFPPTDPSVRAKYQAWQDAESPQVLHAHLAEVDPVAAAIIEPNDPRRTIRALEVIELTGQPFQASKPIPGAPPRFGAILLGLEVDLPWLDARLEQRTEQMFAAGLIEETANLISVGLRDGVTARRAIGYEQALGVIDGTLSRADAVELTFIGTRRYVRRQRSWFKRDQRIHWLSATATDLRDAACAIVTEQSGQSA